MKRVRLQLILAVFWFGSAYLPIAAVLSPAWAWRCAWFNLIIGMVGLLWVTRTELGDRLFYEGPKGDEPGLWLVALLWMIPLVGLVVAVIWWLMRLLGLYNW